MYVLRRKAGTISFYYEAADFAVVLFALGPNNGDVCDRTGGDPHLLTVKDVFIAFAHGAGLHSAGI